MSSLARRYAQAVYDTGLPEADFSSMLHSVMDRPALWESLLSPVVKQHEKLAILRALPELSASQTQFSFLKLLTENHRFSLLPEIATEFHSLVLDEQNAAECLMTCVEIPSEQLQKQLTQLLCKRHNKSKVILIFQIDPTLIGGFTLHIEGVTYDRSVRGQLRDLSRYLEEVNAT